MGFSFDFAQNKSQPIMKVLLVVALAVAAVVAEPEAEAKPESWYGGYYGYPGYYGYGYRYGHYLGKRSADPGLVLPGQPDDKVAISPFGVSVSAIPVVGNPGYALAPQKFAHAYHPVPYHVLGKREAEATPEAEADPEAWYGRYYGGYYGYPYGYGHRYGYGYYGYGHRYWW